MLLEQKSNLRKNGEAPLRELQSELHLALPSPPMDLINSAFAKTKATPGTRLAPWIVLTTFRTDTLQMVMGVGSHLLSPYFRL